MAKQMIYVVWAKTSPVDWSASPEYLTIEYYASRASAEKKCDEMVADKDFHMTYSRVFIEEIEVQP